jgi:hypothetical protein
MIDDSDLSGEGCQELKAMVNQTTVPPPMTMEIQPRRDKPLTDMVTSRLATVLIPTSKKRTLHSQLAFPSECMYLSRPNTLLHPDSNSVFKDKHASPAAPPGNHSACGLFSTSHATDSGHTKNLSLRLSRFPTFRDS